MYVISLYSKYTGDEIHLGSSYETREDAEKADYCERCNSINIHEVPNDYVWANKNMGHISPQRRKAYHKEKSERHNPLESRFKKREDNHNGN